MKPQIRARVFVWDQGGPDEQRGVQISSGARFMFVPAGKVRTLAAWLNGLADQLDADTH